MKFSRNEGMKQGYKDGGRQRWSLTPCYLNRSRLQKLFYLMYRPIPHSFPARHQPASPIFEFFRSEEG